MSNFYYTRWWAPVTRSLAVLGAALFALLVEICARRLNDYIGSAVERYAAAFVITQSVLLIALVTGLSVLKALRLRLSAQRDRRRGEIEEMLVAFAAGEQVDQCAARLGRWYTDSVYVADRALGLVHGQGRARLEELLVSAGFVPLLISDSGSSNPNRAILAVTLLGRLDDPSARIAVEKSLSHPNGAVQVAGCRAILARGSEAVQWQVLSKLPLLPAWQRIVLFHLIPIDSPILLKFLRESLVSGDDSARLVALEFILSRRRALHAFCPAELATVANPEIRIKFFRALSFLQLETNIADVLWAGTADPDWRVRAMAARACGHLRIVELAPALRHMCRADANPVEAGHAARALARLDRNAWAQLQPLVSAGGDMVRRVAAEAMEKSMLGEFVTAGGRW